MSDLTAPKIEPTAQPLPIRIVEIVMHSCRFVGQFWLVRAFNSLGGRLALSHALAICAALFTLTVLISFTEWTNPALLIGGAVVIGGLEALLTIAALFRPLGDVLAALDHLSRGEMVAELPPRKNHPLNPLVTRLNALIVQQGQTGTMRNQLTRQISEAAAQEERHRLARDLHDSIKQQIFSINVSTAAAQARLEADPPALTQARAALADVRQSAQEAMVEMRAMLQQLSPAPLEKSGLVGALRDQCESLAYRTGAQVTTAFNTLPPEDRLPPGAQEALFRVAQEALSNVARHARAQNVSVAITTVMPAAITSKNTGENDGWLMLTIRDDGQGFQVVPLDSAAHMGMGLVNMHERAAALGGQINLESVAGGGTTLTLSIPLIQPAQMVAAQVDALATQDKQLQTAVQYLYLFTFSVNALVFTISLIILRLLRSAERPVEDTVVVIILGVMALVAVIAVPLGVWSYSRLREKRSILRQSGRSESRAYLKLRRYQHLAATSVWLTGFWFTPVIWIGEPFPVWLPLACEMIFFALILWTYLHTFRLYNRMLYTMTPDEQRTEVAKMEGLTRGSWTSLAMLVFMLFITDVFRNGVQLMPTTRDAWVTTAMILITGMLVSNQFLNLAYYMWHQRRLRE